MGTVKKGEQNKSDGGKVLKIIFDIILGFLRFLAVCVSIGLIAAIFGYIVTFGILVALSTINTLFISFALIILSLIVVFIEIIILIFNFIGKKRPKFTLLFVFFILAFVISSAGIGYGVVKIKDFKHVTAEVNYEIYDTSIKYTDDLMIRSDNEINFVIDEKEKDIKIKVNHDKVMNDILVNQENKNDYMININGEFDVKKMIKEIIKDLKNDQIRDYLFDEKVEISIVGNKKHITNVIKNLSEKYYLNIEETNDGYLIKKMSEPVTDNTKCQINKNGYYDCIDTIYEDEECIVKFDKKNKNKVVMDSNCYCDYEYPVYKCKKK